MVSAKIGSEGRGQQLGTRVGTAWILSQALGAAKDKKYALKSLDGCIVSGCWELKRKFQIISSLPLHGTGSMLQPVVQIAEKTPPSLLSTTLDVLDKVVKILAVIIGSAWAYLNYRRGRTFTHRLEPEVSGKIFRYRDAWLLSGVAKVKNVGLSKVSIEQRGTAVIIDDIVLKTSQGEPPKLETEEISNGVLEVFKAHGWIEPGEPIEESFLFALPFQSDRVAVRLGLRIVSEDIEWNADSIAELPQPSQEDAELGQPATGESGAKRGMAEGSSHSQI